MSCIRGHSNKDTELALIRFFRSRQITGWRRRKNVFGKPDFVFPRLKLAIFVDGCFWHGCPLHATVPRSNADFWKKKLTANKVRDRIVNRTLRSLGWSVLRIWEHELKRKNEMRLLMRIRKHLNELIRQTQSSHPK